MLKKRGLIIIAVLIAIAVVFLIGLLIVNPTGKISYEIDSDAEKISYEQPLCDFETECEVKTYLSKSITSSETNQRTPTYSREINYNILDANVSACGTLNSAGETYYLNQSLNPSASTCFTVTANNITLDCQGNNITGSFDPGTYGIYLNAVDNITVKNCNVYQFDSGILLYSSNHGTIINNTIQFNDWGIWLDGSSDNNLENNIVTNNDQGVLFYPFNAFVDSINNTIINNTASNNNINGIYLFYGLDNTLIDNKANNNANYGIRLRYSSNNNLTNNNMSGNGYNFIIEGSADSDFNHYIDSSNTVDGKLIYLINNTSDAVYDSSSNAGTFYVLNSNNITIRDLNLTNNGHGVLFLKTNNSVIENVNASDNYKGISFDQSSNNAIINSTANNNFGGISMSTDSDFNNLTFNTANDNANNGIGVYTDCNNNILINNTANNNGWAGINLWNNSDNNIVVNNTINNNALYGFWIEQDSDYNILNYNTVRENDVGIILDTFVSNNKINYNNIYSNTGLELDSTVDAGTGNNLTRNYWGSSNCPDSGKFSGISFPDDLEPYLNNFWTDANETFCCGNGYTDPGEDCDDGNTNYEDGCSGICEIEECGDGILQVGLGEECDDNNTNSEDGCDSNCIIEFCGDGILQGGLGEDCDDANSENNDSCLNDCTDNVCGDGYLNPPGDGLEECDDNNTNNEDGCDQYCFIEFCGDYTIQEGLGEECDLGGISIDDCCSDYCLVEPAETICYYGPSPGVCEGISEFCLPAGACCIAEDTCSINSISYCEFNLSGVYWHEDTFCSSNPCTSAAGCFTNDDCEPPPSSECEKAICQETFPGVESCMYFFPDDYDYHPCKSETCDSTGGYWWDPIEDGDNCSYGTVTDGLCMDGTCEISCTSNSDCPSNRPVCLDEGYCSPEGEAGIDCTIDPGVCGSSNRCKEPGSGISSYSSSSTTEISNYEIQANEFVIPSTNSSNSTLFLPITLENEVPIDGFAFAFCLQDDYGEIGNLEIVGIEQGAELIAKSPMIFVPEIVADTISPFTANRCGTVDVIIALFPPNPLSTGIHDEFMIVEFSTTDDTGKAEVVGKTVGGKINQFNPGGSVTVTQGTIEILESSLQPELLFSPPSITIVEGDLYQIDVELDIDVCSGCDVKEIEFSLVDLPDFTYLVGGNFIPGAGTGSCSLEGFNLVCSMGDSSAIPDGTEINLLFNSGIGYLTCRPEISHDIRVNADMVDLSDTPYDQQVNFVTLQCTEIPGACCESAISCVDDSTKSACGGIFMDYSSTCATGLCEALECLTDDDCEDLAIEQEFDDECYLAECDGVSGCDFNFDNGASCNSETGKCLNGNCEPLAYCYLPAVEEEEEPRRGGLPPSTFVWGLEDDPNKTYTLRIIDPVKFKIKGKEHTVKIKRIYSDYVTIEISSDPIIFDLRVGESKEVDVDFDGTNDLLVTLDEIINIANARVTFSAIEEIPVVDEPIVEKPAEIERKEPTTKILITTGIIVIILFLILYDLYSKKKRKNRVKKKQKMLKQHLKKKQKKRKKK